MARLLPLVVLAACAAAWAQEVTVFRTTSQGELKIHIFKPEGWHSGDRRSGIILFFGGGFLRGNPDQFFSKARYLASRGMVAASAEYRVKDRHQTTPQDAFQDCTAAVRWMKEKASSLGIDPAKLAAGGGSAGGMCALEAAEREPVAALVLYNPVADNRPVKPLPPASMFFGAADKFLEGARQYQFAAMKAGNRVELFTAPGQPHGFFNDRGPGQDGWHLATLHQSDLFLMSVGLLRPKPTFEPPAGARLVRQTPLPPGARFLPDLTYKEAGGKDLQLDLAIPAGAASPLPLVIYVHGGAWQSGSRKNNTALRLLDRGFAVANVSYRLSGEAQFPAQIEDCQDAVRWLRKNAAQYGLDPARFAAWGDSAGGHLVALLGTMGAGQTKVQAVVDYYGPTDFLQMAGQKSNIVHDAPDSPESKLLGAPIREVPDKVRQANPIAYVTKDDAPFLIVHGTADMTVPYNQSVLLETALKQAGVPVEFLPVEGGGHGGRNFLSGPVMERVAEFLSRTLKGTTR